MHARSSSVLLRGQKWDISGGICNTKSHWGDARDFRSTVTSVLIDLRKQVLAQEEEGRAVLTAKLCITDMEPQCWAPLL